MRMIRIEEGKKDKMSEYAEKMLKYGGKLMQCIEELGEGSMGNRDDDDDDWDDDDDMGMRDGMGYRENMGSRRMRESGGMGYRRSSRTGRYIR